MTLRLPADSAPPARFGSFRLDASPGYSRDMRQLQPHSTHSMLLRTGNPTLSFGYGSRVLRLDADIMFGEKMTRTETSLLVAVLAASGIAAIAADYSDFTGLSEEKKDRLVWELHERREWGLPEQKPICRDLLANQGYRFANAIAWTTDAIDLAEKQGWTDLKPLVAKIYEAPRNIWVYERAFRCLRNQEAKPVSSNVVEDAEALRRAGAYRPTVTDKELDKVKERLTENSDKEAVLVFALGVAGWHAGKGGTERGRLAAIEVLRQLPRDDVANRVRQLHRDCEGYMRPEIEWVAQRLNVELGNDTPNQTPEGTARKLAAHQR